MNGSNVCLDGAHSVGVLGFTLGIYHSGAVLLSLVAILM